MSPPTQQKALLLQAKQGEFVVGTRPVPKPAPGEILVKNEYVALNPADWKIRELGFMIQTYPAVLGIDASGTVEAVGEGVDKFKLGDKVLYAGLPDADHATFQQYTLINAGLAAKLPESLSLEQGAALPLAIITPAVALYNQAGGPRLTPPWVSGGKGKYAGTPVVIVGGASVIGSLAIQFAKLSGFSPIITTASLKNAPLLKEFGATHVLDRNLSPSALYDAVVAITGAPVKLVLDTITVPDTERAAFALVAPGGKLLIHNQPSVLENPTADGRSVTFTSGIIQLPENQEFGKVLYEHVPALLASGDLKPLHTEIIPGGLAAIPIGLDRLKNNQVSARKLVLKVEESD
ncbi:GroES-like protein [Lenzites betulinus]|nr:GroES-like protein [Lenzites betulinus]